MKKNFISLKDKLTKEQLEEFDYEKNDKKPEEISYGSDEKIYWKCKLGHEYLMTANKRTYAKNGCPYCANQKVLAGFNDLATLYPDIAKTWDYDNNELKPTEIRPFTNKKYYWKCDLGHSYYMEPGSRIKGCNCNICSNRTVLKGFNDLAFKNPELAKQWSEDNKLKTDEIVFSSHEKAIWEHVVEKDGQEFLHKWEATIASRTLNGNGCPYCANQKIIKGYNDLKTLRPDLVKEWDYDKNTKKPTEIPLNSTYKAHWKHIAVKNGKEFVHEWQSVVYSRTNSGRNCPICAGKQVQIGFNDLKSFYPNLAKEWDYELNDKKPEELSLGTNYKAHWICSKGHKYMAGVPDRRLGDGCPTCSKRLRISLNEKIIYYYIKKLFPDTIGSYKADWLGRMEIDIFIPSLKFGIEYDGQRWHMDKYQHDLDKNKLCKDNDVKLYRVREPKCPVLPSKNVYQLKTLNKKELEDVITEITNILSKRTRKVLKLDIDIARDMNEIMDLLEK